MIINNNNTPKAIIYAGGIFPKEGTCNIDLKDEVIEVQSKGTPDVNWFG